MSSQDAFFTMTFRQADRALLDLIGRGRFNLQPDTITRTLKRRTMGRLKQLETIVRRLLFLMAMALKLAPVAPRPARPRVEPDLPEGTIIIPIYSPYRPFKLITLVAVEGPPDALWRYGRALGRANAWPVYYRLARLRAILKDPGKYARRFARLLEKMRKNGTPAPVAMPAGENFRLRPELGAIATALPQLIKQATEGWYDTS